MGQSPKVKFPNCSNMVALVLMYQFPEFTNILVSPTFWFQFDAFLPVEGHSRRLHVPLSEIEILFQFIQHCSTTRMDAKMFKCKLEVGDVRFDLHFQQFPCHQSCEEEDLFRKWEH